MLGADAEGGPFQFDPRLGGELARQPFEFDFGEAGAVRGEFDLHAGFRHGLFDQLFAGARVGGAQAGVCPTSAPWGARIVHWTRAPPTGEPASIRSAAALLNSE